MDVYGVTSAPDYFRIDDLLDFSNDNHGDAVFSSSSPTSTATTSSSSLPPPQTPSFYQSAPFHSPPSTDFIDRLSVPSDDVAELEWLSQFVDDSFADFPPDALQAAVAATVDVRSDASFSTKARGKRSRAAAEWTFSPDFETPAGKPKSKRETTSRASSPTAEEGGVVRRCTHCASEKTPQWRTGPLGPKTLCNACGVRFKSGRLVPEYRPAASPTFVLTQHSNSHRKVMELRRQKELLRQQQQNHQQQQQQQQQHHQQQIYHHHQQVC